MLGFISQANLLDLKLRSHNIFVIKIQDRYFFVKELLHFLFVHADDIF
jgi:hypothetical protein